MTDSMALKEKIKTILGHLARPESEKVLKAQKYPRIHI